jgi:iron complex outermembrane receptor protein
MKIQKYVSASALAMASMVYAAAAHAQSAPANRDEAQSNTSSVGDIIVTAQRRSESLQKVPIAISAFSEASLTNAGITNTEQLVHVSPSMVINMTAGQFATFIRGVGTRIAEPGIDPSVPVYVDDRYESSANASLTELLDVARVEVVKGPQGVLFGRNATGGAVRIITNDPVNRLEGNIRATYGNYDAKELRGTINLPVTDTLAARFSALYVGHDGYARNIAPTGPRRYDNQNFIALRGKLAWMITPDVTAKLSVDYFKQRDTSGLAFQALPPFDVNSLLAAGALTGRRPGEVAIGATNPTNQREPSGELRVDANLGGVSIASITTYARPDVHVSSDNDGTTAASSDAVDFHVHHIVWTQELQLVSNNGGPLNWLIGGYYYHENGFVESRTLIPTLVSPFGRQQVKTDSLAGFAQLTYKFTDSLSLIVGGRYGHEKKELLVTATPGVLNLFDTTLSPYSRETSFSKFTPRAVLQWNFDRDSMVYASYSRGIKGGGFALPAIGATILRPEVLDSYEVGLKAGLLENRIQFNAAAFYYDYKDLQVSRGVVLPSGAFVVTTENAATSRIKGIEADLRVRPTSALLLSGGLTYLDAKYTQFPASARIFKIDTPNPGNGLGTVLVPLDAAGRQLLYAPKFAAYVSAEYGMDIGANRLVASGTFSYKSSYELDFVVSPRTSAERQPPYTQLSARLTYELSDPKLSVAVFANNITDKRYLVDGSINAAGPKGIYSPPRTYGVQVGYSF